ncbi:MAG: hypothetical protein ACPLKQ_04150 [Candidatus Bathyarchaeales archaeon]
MEPLVAIVAGLDYPPHGLLHTFLVSMLAGALVGFVLYLVREQVTPYMADLALVDKEGSLKSFILAGIAGWAFHVLLDSLLLYPEMKPFYPLDFNLMFLLKFDQVIFQAYGLLFLAGVLVYPIHLYRTLRSESKATAEISVGLVLVGLGVITIPADILCHAGFLLTVAGFFMLALGLKRIMPHLSRRIFSSSVMLAAAAALIYSASPHMLELTLEQYISGLHGLGLSTILIGSYILSLLALAILWPALRLLQRNLNDSTLSLSINLLISGWVLALLLIPLLVVALSYIIIVIKTPHKLRCSKEKILT